MTSVYSPTSRPAVEVRSERARRAIAAGDVMVASRLLGRPFAVHGVVVVGNQLGRTIGVPTANLAPCYSGPTPARGVYQASVRLPDGERWPAAANVGVRPTLGTAGELRIEAHLIGFDGDLYGSEIEVAFHRWLRNEQRFASLEDLKAQLFADIREAALLSTEGL
jgi:riboflavin kinase/FMN adenylyltransferase